MRSNLRAIECRMDGCRCGQLHPAFRDCPDCRGVGLRMGGDELQPCPACKARFDGLPIAVSMAGGQALEEQRAREREEDRIDALAKETALD